MGEEEEIFSKVVKPLWTYMDGSIAWKESGLKWTTIEYISKIFYLMYYIHIFLDSLVILSLPTPPVPLAFPGLSQGPKGLHQAESILPACASPPCYPARERAVQHPPLSCFRCSPLATFSVVGLIRAYIRPKSLALSDAHITYGTFNHS